MGWRAVVMGRAGRWGVVIVTVLVVAGMVVGIRARSDRSESSMLPQEDVLASYRILYDVEEHGAEPRREERIVLRPYFSSAVSTRDGHVLSATMTNREGRWVLRVDPGEWYLRDEGPQRPGDDPRPLEAIRFAAARGIAEVRGSDEVLGRACVEVRTGGLPGASLEAPSADDHLDLCVDRTGLILRERWVVNGTTARLSVATELELDPSIDDDTFTPEPRAAEVPDGTAGLSRVRPVAASEAGIVAAMRPPNGFRRDGDVVAVERPVANGVLDVSYRASYVSGPRLVVVDQRVGAPGAMPAGIEVDLGHGITGAIDLGLTASTLAVVVDTGVHVRFRGPDVLALLAFGEALAEQVAGGRRP